jgi:hypothetical protein
MQKQTLPNPFANINPQKYFNQQPQQQNPKKEEKKKSKKALLLLLLLLLIPAVWYFKGVFIGNQSISRFANQEVGDLSKMSKDELVATLNNAVHYEYFSMAMAPVFENGTAEGEVLIVNDKNNQYPHLVEIYTADDHTLLLSGAVDVGCKVEKAKLLVDLPKGVYPCKVYFTPFDPETGKKIRTYDFDLTINVLN